MAEMQIGTEIFNVEIDGPVDAPPLLVSNSLGTDLHMWDGQMPVLTQKFRVIRYDSRGHGGSIAEDGPYSIEQLGQDALNILDALDISKANYLGLSLGGMVGMWLMTHHGHRIEKAVLANTGAQLGNYDFWNMRIRTSRNEGMEPLVAGTIERWFSPEFCDRAPDEVAKVAQMVRDTPPLGYASCCAAIRDMDQREAIRSIKNPVLVIVGTKDPATPPAMGGLIAGTIPGARLIDLDAAHLSNIEAEAAFTRAVVSFLSPPQSKPAGKPAAKSDVKPASQPATETSQAPEQKAPAKKSPAKKAAKKKTTTKTAAKKKKSAKKKTAKKTAAKKSAKKQSAKKKSVKKAAPKKSAKKKTAKKAAKKAAKKTVKKTAKKAAKKTAKKAAKKSRSAKKQVRRTTRASAKKTVKKAARKSPKKAVKAAKKPARKSARKTARKTARKSRR